jgi:hypothetical protein
MLSGLLLSLQAAGPSLYAVFLSAISRICDPEMTFFWNLSSNYQSSLVFLYANSLNSSLFLESLSLAQGTKGKDHVPTTSQKAGLTGL